jgi:Mn2+/Fe2+ NRAMP family transporter
MATSAIGPGFLTQTTVFTQRLGASFGFVILASVLLDIGAQLNIWRIIAVAERRAPDIANQVVPGLGHVLIALIALGGLAFNIGNVAGAGLGLNALTDISLPLGAALSAAFAIGIFLFREAGKAMDRFAQAMGVLMIVLTVYVAISAAPPVGEAVVRTVVPTQLSMLAIVTLVGGTVGGYITFAGGHRLLDAGVSGVDQLRAVNRSAVTGIVVTAIMRVVLFLAVLGVISKGMQLDAANPPASVFRNAAGTIGYRMFGLVMWAAAVTSIVGSSYTSVSFLRSLHNSIERRGTVLIIAFIIVSTAIFLLVGRPVKILIAVGALNGLILPISLGAMLLATRQRSVVRDYRHPAVLTVIGVLTALIMAALGGYTLFTELPKLFNG